MTKRQIRRASRIYVLALVANSDFDHWNSGDTPEQEADQLLVLQHAVDGAQAKIGALGLNYGALLTLRDCIEATK